MQIIGRGEAIGAVFLKKLSNAIADGDQVLGVISATAINQNQNTTPIFVPNPLSLTDVFRTVIKKSSVAIKDISVVEAHGTGTVSVFVIFNIRCPRGQEPN
jgi:acyl transferase domain-containing protein